MFQCHIDIGKGLRLYTLRRINHQQRAFTGCQCTTDLIGKIHMSGCVDQVQDILIAVLRMICHMNRFAFNGDSAFSFQFHAVQDLLNHFAFFKHAGFFEYSVRKCTFAVIYMSDNAEIPDSVHIGAHEILRLSDPVSKFIFRAVDQPVNIRVVPGNAHYHQDCCPDNDACVSAAEEKGKDKISGYQQHASD